MKCENCGNENVKIITKETGYSCPYCGRDTEVLKLKELVDVIGRFEDINELTRSIKEAPNNISTITELVKYLEDELLYMCIG